MLHNTNHDVPHPGDVDYAMLDMTSLRCASLVFLWCRAWVDSLCCWWGGEGK